MRPSLGARGGVHRWGPLFVATLATALLALAVGDAGNLAAGVSPPAPQLKTVSAATLFRLGLSLQATAQPPYCGLTNSIPRPGWLTTPPAGCAVPRPTAEAAARAGSSNVRVLEDVLALVTSSPPTLVGRNHLTWLLVVQRTGLAPVYGGACPSRAGRYIVCPGGWSRGSNWLVLVDGRTARVMGTLLVTAPPFRTGRVRAGIPPRGA